MIDRAGKMAQRVKRLLGKPGNLNLIPGIHVIFNEIEQKISDQWIAMCVYINTHTLINISLPIYQLIYHYICVYAYIKYCDVPSKFSLSRTEAFILPAAKGIGSHQILSRSFNRTFQEENYLPQAMSSSGCSCIQWLAGRYKKAWSPSPVLSNLKDQARLCRISWGHLLLSVAWLLPLPILAGFSPLRVPVLRNCSINILYKSQEWWYTPIISGFGKLRQKDCTFEASLGVVSH